MKVRDVMSNDVQVARPDDRLQEIAMRMQSGDFGFMPVADGDRLVGTVTDRDIVVRGVARGLDSAATAGEVMTHDVTSVRDDADLKTVLETMGGRQIRRLPVVDKNERLVGVISLGDLSTRVKEKYAGAALEDISRTG